MGIFGFSDTTAVVLACLFLLLFALTGSWVPLLGAIIAAFVP